MTDIIIEANDFNTQITKELFNSLNQEVREELMEFVSSIDFIQKIISPNIKRAKDLPKDESGRIIIDVTEPHRLEDMDYFRPSALHFIKTGRYTDYKPSKVPNSPFRKWISEERRRCYEGYVRESDGEWITGDYYFFLNYCPMMSQMKDDKAGISVMKMAFPLVMDGQYYFSHYIWQARLHNNNAVCLASRGRGKSAFTGAMLTKRAELGETSEARKFCSSMVVASATKYLDGAETIIGRFTKYLDHVAKNTKWPRRRIRNTTNNLRWEIGYMNNDGTKGGVQNTVVGVTVGDDPGKIRGSRASLFVIEEFGSFGKLKELYENLIPSVKNGNDAYGQMVCVGCCCAGTKIFDKDGNLINIEDINDSIIGFNGNNASIEDVTYIQPEAYKECVEIITTNGNIRCSIDHPLLKLNKDLFTHSKGTCSFYRANELKIGDILLMHGNDIFGKEHEDNAYLLGALFGDGNYSEKSNITLSITTEEEYDFYNSYYKIGISKLRNTFNGGMYAQIYFKKELYSLLKKYEMSGKAFENKCLPNNIWQWDKDSIADFLAGYFDADGNVQIIKNKHRSIKLSCKYKNILEQIQYLLQKFNIYSYILKEDKPGRLLHSVVNNKDYEIKPTVSYVLYICNGSDVIRFRENIHLKINYKRERLESYVLQKERNRYNKLDFEYREKNGKGKYFINKSLYDLKGTKILDIKNIGVQRIYNLTANTTHTYLSNGFISSNTAGDKDSDFEGAKELFYNPIGHDIEPLRNVWDKAASGRNTIAFFYPAYLNTKEYYDKDGNSDVLGALIFYLKERHKKKYNSDDPMTLVKYCAENPITPEESMMKTARSYFPVAELNERIKQLENDSSAFDEVEVGELFFKDDGTVDFKHTRELPIRFFPHNDNKIRGAVEIFTRPVKDETTRKPVPGRYIASCIPEGEKILTSNGIKNIEDVLLNDKLYSINGDLVEIRNHFKRYVENEKLMHIQLFDIIDEYKLTWNHPIYCATQKKHYHQSKYAQKNNLSYVYRTYNFNFLRAEDIKEGMFVKVPNIYKGEGTIPYYLWNDDNVRIDRTIENPLDKKDFWWLVGLIIGDGWANTDRCSINCCFNSNEKEYIDKYKRIVSSIFGRSVVCVKKEEENKKCVEYSFCNKQFNEFFKYNFGVGAENKNLPEWVKFLPNDLKVELLMGYLASDGYVSKNGIEYVSISKKLLKDFQDILFSIGIISSLTKLRNAKIHTFNYKGKIYTSKTKETYHLRIHGKYAYKFLNKSYLDYKLKNLEIKELENHEIIRVFFEDNSERFIYFKVRKVDCSTYTGVVYNFHCDTSTYMYGCLPTHNCDPIDKDSADTMSLSSTFVFDLYTDTIVAEYTGRRDLAVENYEITRMLCHYYNAQCYFENNLLGFKSYMQTKGDLIKYVALTPNNLKTQGIAPRESVATGNYGIRTTLPVIDQMNLLIRDWITDEVPAEDDNGNEIKVKNLYLVKNIALLKELVLYNDKGNFDRVRSFGLLMIGRDECLMRSGGIVGEKPKYDNCKEDKFIKQCISGGNRKYKDNVNYEFTPMTRNEINSLLNKDTKMKMYKMV